MDKRVYSRMICWLDESLDERFNGWINVSLCGWADQSMARRLVGTIDHGIEED